MQTDQTESGDGSEAAFSGAPAGKSATGHVMHEAVWRGNGGLEIVLMPVLTGFFGYVLDQSVGTSPLFLIVLAIIGFLGAVASQYYRYTAQMAALHEARVARREAAEAQAREAGQAPASFGLVDEVEFPTYVVPDSRQKEDAT